MEIVVGLFGVILFFGAVVIGLLWLWVIAHRRQKARRWTRETSLFCAQCSTLNEGTAQFCGQCRSTELLGHADFARLEASRSKDEIREIQETQVRNRVIRRIAELRGQAWCPVCACAHADGVVFCTKCGADIADHVVPDSAVFPLIQVEFPAVVGSFRCYETLRDSQPEGGLLQRGLKDAAGQFRRMFERLD